MNFSEALVLLKQGIYMKRKGWRGDVMQICIFTDSGCPDDMDYIECKSPEGEYQPWAPSHRDVLADDWYEPLEQIK